MDKVLSARVDEAVLHRIGSLARRLGTTKKAVIEAAICAYAEKVEASGSGDIMEQTSGAWKREEPPEETVRRAREAFNRAMERRRT